MRRLYLGTARRRLRRVPVAADRCTWSVAGAIGCCGLAAPLGVLAACSGLEGGWLLRRVVLHSAAF
eukprot:11288274-Alexandrium_andersonii.AAC.1